MYEQRSRNELPSGGAFNRDQVPQREGLTEHIRMRDGRERVTRRFDASSGDYTFTALGRSFYSKRRSQYVVHIPVVIEGRRKDGTSYELNSFMPTERMGIERVSLPQTLTQRQRDARVKEPC